MITELKILKSALIEDPIAFGKNLVLLACVVAAIAWMFAWGLSQPSKPITKEQIYKDTMTKIEAMETATNRRMKAWEEAEKGLAK